MIPFLCAVEFFTLLNFSGSSHPNFVCWNIILRGRKCARGEKNGEDRNVGRREGEREVFEIYGERDMQMEQILLCSDAIPCKESF